jgi:hypothetical protein
MNLRPSWKWVRIENGIALLRISFVGPSAEAEAAATKKTKNAVKIFIFISPVFATCHRYSESNAAIYDTLSQT